MTPSELAEIKKRWVTSIKVDMSGMWRFQYADQDIATLVETVEKYKAALEKIADPRLRDHKEPDAYTELGCVMNIAQEALK